MRKLRWRGTIAGSLVVVFLLAGCADDEGVTPSSMPVESNPIPTSAPDTAAEPSATIAETVSSEPQTTAATVGTDPVSPADPPEASRFNSPMVSLEPFLLSPEAIELFDGLLLSVPVDIVFEDGGRGWTTSAVLVADGEASIVMGRWCNWEYSPALSAIGGSVFFDSGTICTPGERYQRVPESLPLASAWFEERRLVLVPGRDGLRHLDLDSLTFESVVDMDWAVERPAAASFGSGQWVVVMAESGSEPDDARSRVVFIDPRGSMIVHENNPFPEFGEQVRPRAASLDPNGTTLIVALEDENRATDLVYWDLETGVELSRHRIIDPSDRSENAREFVSSIDVLEGRVLVNLTAVALEYLPAGSLLVDREGNVADLSDQGEIVVVGADFLED